MKETIIEYYELPKVKDCIKYIESCGYTFVYYNRPWYVFKGEHRPIGPPGREVTFTLTEIRQAYVNGW